MAQINKPSDYFNTILWSGNGSTNALTGVGFQPDWVWVKERSSISNHQTYDAVRGTTKQLEPNTTGAEGTISTGVTSFDTDGFTVGNNLDLNASGDTYVGWNWLASNTTASNTDGSITSTVSANTTSGFSICTFTQASSGSFTFGHGLGVAPDMIIGKSRGNVSNWQVYHKSLGTGKFIQLNSTGASQTVADFWGTIDTSIVTIGTNQLEASQPSVYYCFNEVKGFSKFGSYTGNGNADGTFIYTGFKPAWVMIKQTNAAGEGWHILDNKRSGVNGDMERLLANSNNAESNYAGNLDLLSNGFKTRINDPGVNSSGATYIYMTFAEEPLVGTNNIPATAR